MKKVLKTASIFIMLSAFFLPVFVGIVPGFILIIVLIILLATSAAAGFKKEHTHTSFSRADIIAARSRLSVIHPTVKLIFVLVSIFLCISSKNPLFPFVISLVMFFITCFYGKTEYTYYISMFFIPLIFLFTGGIVLLFDISKDPSGYLNFQISTFYLCVTQESRREAVLVTFRAIGSLSCMYMLSFSTPVTELAGLLKKCGLEIISELIYLIYRYIFIIAEMHRKMTEAAEARLGYNGFRHSVFTFSHIASNLFVLSFKRASDCYDAMEARMYDGKIEFLEKEKKIRAVHILTFTVLTVAFVFLYVLTDYLLRRYLLA